MVALLAIAFVWAHQTGEWLHEQRPIPLKNPAASTQVTLPPWLDHLRHVILNLSDQWNAFEQTLQFFVLY